MTTASQPAAPEAGKKAPDKSQIGRHEIEVEVSDRRDGRTNQGFALDVYFEDPGPAASAP